MGGQEPTREIRHRKRLGDDPAAPVVCTECERRADEATTTDEGWTYWSDGFRALLPYCPECAAREFGYYATY